VGSPNIGSRQWIWRQYDHIVRAGTVVRPGAADAAVVRVLCEDGEKQLEKYLVLSVDCNGRHVQLDPKIGAAMAVAECARNIVCTGGKPLGLTDCLNFGSPERPETMWQFSQSIDGIADACKTLGIPVVSGNVSFYNETDGRPILPTPTVAIVGQLERLEDRLTLGFKREGDVIAHLGTRARGSLGGSEWLAQHVGRAAGTTVGIDLDAEKRLQMAVLALARAHVLSSAHDVSDGGLGACLAECCIAEGFGATIRIPGAEMLPPQGALFSEEPSRVIASYPASNRASVEALCAEHGVMLLEIGRVGGDRLILHNLADVAVAELAASHAAALDDIVGPDG